MRRTDDKLGLVDTAIERLAQLRDGLEDGWVTFDRSNLEFFRRIFERIDGKGKTILEVGSGFGMTCMLFGLLGAREAHGIELIDRAVASANQMRDRLDPSLPVFFQQHDAAKPLPFPNGRFDALLLIEVISHVVCRDFRAFMAEMARVVKPGGVIYISDGNNGYSPHRRKVNQEIWNRFENGPPTAPGETVHTHYIKTPYVESRREIAMKAVPGLAPDDYSAIAKHTFAFTAPEVEAAARTYAHERKLPSSVFKKGICPIEPNANMYIEKMFDPFELSQLFRDLGFKIKLLTTRRAFPLQQLLDAVPRLTMLVSNGFVLMAEKLPQQA